ncbi:DUF6348 family protein [Mucilaginibacter paludis]|uniref:Uncharacterized protein n=1 Tax=Mucilaginibacter paludis DSM 18603 TaxID=714943 RepID=H1Y2N0_9SPHI|nr:DUF6348 family protein [Mucilaginibacter paludis]EHQ28209.1 hypothetical protein Mucpa_4118 [Mucilaginibacter paludis DSM 18603]
MSLFNFFKKSKIIINQPEKQNATTSSDRNLNVLESFKSKLTEIGYQVEWHSQYLALMVNSDLEIGATIVDVPGAHPSLIQLIISASHYKYFPNGIIEYVVGIATSLQDRINAALDNYINSIFLTIIDGFSDSHNPELDFMTIGNGNEILWHPKLGNLMTQGQWGELPLNEIFFNLLNDKITHQLTLNKINWLKIYISQKANGEIIGECLFNNEPWEAALNTITNYASGWDMIGEFKGLKQFIVFRRCDAYD